MNTAHRVLLKVSGQRVGWEFSGMPALAKRRRAAMIFLPTRRPTGKAQSTKE